MKKIFWALLILLLALPGWGAWLTPGSVPSTDWDPDTHTGNLGKTYFMNTGNATTGSWGLYTIERNSNTIAYTYAVRAIIERTW